MLPRGNHWGFRGLSSASKKVRTEGNPGCVSGRSLRQSRWPGAWVSTRYMQSDCIYIERSSGWKP